MSQIVHELLMTRAACSCTWNNADVSSGHWCNVLCCVVLGKHTQQTHETNSCNLVWFLACASHAGCAVKGLVHTVKYFGC